jgi:hypothetical protein
MIVLKRKMKGCFNYMISFIFKIIIYPIALLSSDYLFRDIYYSYTYQAIFVSIVLAVSAHLIEFILLKPGTLIISTVADFLLAFVVTYFSQFLLPGSVVMLIGAALFSSILAVIEFFQHLLLIYNGRTRKWE